jgi:site-specific DNA recombinase
LPHDGFVSGIDFGSVYFFGAYDPGNLGLASEETMTDDLLSNDVRPFTVGPKKDIMAYPSSWANTFGNNFYRHAQAQELAAFDNQEEWNVNEEGQPFNDSQVLNVTNSEVVGSKIKQIISNMEQETLEDGK